MAANLYNQYAWLVDTIRTAGRITKREIDERWARSPLNEKGDKVYPLRSFHRHKDAIADLLGIYIGCDKFDGNRYYISDRAGNMGSDFRTKLCNVLTFANLLLDSPDMQKKVVWSRTNDGSEHLATLLDAMRNKRLVMLKLTQEKGASERIVLPYCIAQNDMQWYLAAKDDKSGGEIEVISLVDVRTVNVLKTKGVVPKWFKGDMFFASYFGKVEPIADKKRTKSDSKKQKTNAASAETKNSKAESETGASANAQLSLF